MNPKERIKVVGDFLKENAPNTYYDFSLEMPDIEDIDLLTNYLGAVIALDYGFWRFEKGKFKIDYYLLARALNGFTVIDHISKDMDYSGIEDFRNKKKLAQKIVNHDLDFIKKSDVIVAISDSPSYGTAIEMFVAKESGKKVILFSEKEIPTPWPIAFSDYIVKSDKDLILVLKEKLSQKGNFST